MTRRLLTLARDSRLALAATVLSGLLTGLLTIGQSAGLSRIVNGGLSGGAGITDMTGLFRLLLLIVFLRALLAWGSEISCQDDRGPNQNDLRQRLFDKLLSLGPAYTRRERTGELVNTAVEGIEALDAYFSQYLPQLVIAALVPLSILDGRFSAGSALGLVLLLTAPLIPVFMFLIGKTAEALTRRQWDTLSRLSAHFLDSLQGLTTLKELGRSRDHANSIAEASDRFRDVTLSVLRVTFLSALVLELVATLSTAVVAVEIGLRLLYGQMAFQQAFFLLLLAPEFYIPLRMLGLRFHAGMSGTTAARRIFEILDVPAVRSAGIVSQGKTGIHRPRFIKSALIVLPTLIRMKPNLHCRIYAWRSHPVSMSLWLAPAEPGKSTLAALLLRFMEPDERTNIH